ncbi:MAG TPA: hypothetical protein PKZ32_14520 [Candidatus Melainabacteria bacterium]|nr:hypothetical protein [Candidatus Melainabacteria bacterium]
MVQSAAYEGGWSEATTSGGTRGDSISDNFYQQFSSTDISQFYAGQRANGGDSVSAMLGGLEIVDKGTTSTIWIENGRNDSGAFRSSGSGEKVDHTSHLSRSGWDQPADGGDAFGRRASGSKFDYEQIQMSGASGEQIAKVKPGDRAQGQSQETAIRNLNDAMTQRVTEFPTADDLQKSQAIAKDILAGKNVTEAINKLGRDERSRIMAMVKTELLKMPGTSVVASENADRSQDLVFRTKDGAIVLISEDSYGNPTNIQARGKGWTSALGWRTATGAVSVYENPDAKPVSPGGGSNPVDYLRRQAHSSEGNGPLARYMRGEELSGEDWKQIEEAARRSGGKINIVKPHGARGE